MGESAMTDKVFLALPSHRGLDRLLDLALRRSLPDRLPLVVDLLPHGEAHLDLRPPLLEVDRERDERHPLLGRLAGKPDDLILVKEDLPRPERLVVRVPPRS